MLLINRQKFAYTRAKGLDIDSDSRSFCRLSIRSIFVLHSVAGQVDIIVDLFFLSPLVCELQGEFAVDATVLAQKELDLFEKRPQLDDLVDLVPFCQTQEPEVRVDYKL